MDPSIEAQRTRLHIGTALYAHRVMIILCAVTGILFGVIATSFLPTIYTATASVLIQPLDGNPYSPNAQGSDLTNLETEAQVVASDVIANDVKQALAKADMPTNARKNLRIAVAPNTQIMQITYNGPESGSAEATALQYASSYLDLRTARRDEFIDSKRDAITQRIDDLTAQLAQLRKDKRDTDDPEVRSIGAQQTNLRLQLASLDTADSNPGEIIAAPRGARSGLSIGWQLGAPAGLLLGLATGVIVALVLERRSEVLRTIDDVEHLGVPVLGNRVDPDADEPDGGDSGETSYGVANLVGTILNRRAEGPATVAVSSLSGGSSVSAFINDLANVLSHGREDVLLIDAASDIPTRAAGFSEVLAGTSELQAALVKRVRGKPVDPVARLKIGKNPEKGFSLYATSRMSDALDSASEHYNWVLVDSPSSDLTTGRAIVGACRYWIPIVELGVASRKDLERGLAWARTTGVETLGVVAVDSPLDIFGRAKQRGSEPVSGD